MSLLDLHSLRLLGVVFLGNGLYIFMEVAVNKLIWKI
jgi:hypothetical protein